MIMIQPRLKAYSFNGPPELMALNIASIQPNRILILDAFFYTVIFYGSAVAQWRRAGYHTMQQYNHFAQLLEAVRIDTSIILYDRFPIPNVIECEQHSSQARFLLAKLNPSASHVSHQSHSELMMTDDISYESFYACIRKQVTENSEYLHDESNIGIEAN